MVDHMWGDEDFDWDGLERARQEIFEKFRFATGGILISKEKYGSIRYERLLLPGTAYYITDADELWTANPAFQATYREFMQFKLWEIIQRVAGKYPHIEDEIICDFASREEVVGHKVHDKYWTRRTLC